MACKIKFYGCDFTEIDKYLDETLNKNSYEGFDFNLTEEYLHNILICFLNSVKDYGGLIINGKSGDVTELFHEWKDAYWFGGIVGVLSKKIILKRSAITEETEDNGTDPEYEIEVVLQIQSRFDRTEDEKLGRPYFLSTMLVDSNYMLNRDFLPANNDDYFFDLLLLNVFRSKLEKSNMKGLFRTYHRFEKNDDRVRGSIDISRHIKENVGQNNGRVAYSYRDNTIDNYLNHLILAAYNHLKKKYFCMVNSIFDSKPELKKIIDNMTFFIGYPKYDVKTLIMKNIRPISHPFYTEYEALRKVCLRILRNEGISLFDGTEDDTVDGILFYIPDLWEKYLERFLRDSEYYFQPQRLLELIDYNNDRNYRQSTYPDFVFFNDGKGEEPFMVLDAKFKPSWGEIIKNKLSFSDVLSDYDKCVRDMVSINSHATGVIFPTNIAELKEAEEYIEHSICEHNKVDKFLSFPVYVPFAKDKYNEWYNEFDNNCKIIIRLLKTRVVQEQEYMNRISQLRKAFERERTN